MRIAILTTSYPAFPGDPSGHFVETEARSLARDHEVVVVTASADETSERGQGSVVEAGGVTVLRIDGGTAFGWPGVAARVHERPARIVSAAVWIWRARAALRSLPPFDGVVAHWALPCGFPLAAACPRTTSASLEIVSHGADVRLLTRLPWVARRAIVSRLLRDATRWRFVSHALQGDLARTIDVDLNERLESIALVRPAAIEVPDVSASASIRRAQRGRKHEHARMVVCVGRLVTGKRFDRALAHVAHERTVHGAGPTRVVIVGDGPERARLEAYARDLGIEAHFVGRTSRDVALAWIGAADALLHASHSEGLSTVVREAEALGVPVLVVA